MALHLMPDGLHQVGLAHAHAAIEEQRIVGLRGPLGHGQRGGMRELVAVADHEGIERVLGVQLRRAVEVEARLLRAGARRRAVNPPLWRNARDRGRRRAFGDHELHVLELEPQILDRLLDEVGVAFAHLPEFGRRHANVQRHSLAVAVTQRLKPGIVGVAIDLLFQRVQNTRPGIRRTRYSCGHGTQQPEVLTTGDNFY